MSLHVALPVGSTTNNFESTLIDVIGIGSVAFVAVAGDIVASRGRLPRPKNMRSQKIYYIFSYLKFQATNLLQLNTLVLSNRGKMRDMMALLHLSVDSRLWSNVMIIGLGSYLRLYLL